MRKFPFGFPLLGKLSRNIRFPQKENDLQKAPGKAAQDSSRTSYPIYRQREKIGLRECPTHLGRRCPTCGQGWIIPPFPLATAGKPSTLSRSQQNIDFRFGVHRNAKLRAFDDIRRAMTNLAFVVESPIKLVSWDRLVEISNPVNSKTMDCAFSKADREASYKQLHLAGGKSHLSVVALRSPIDERWYGFIFRTMVFVTTDAALRYNVFLDCSLVFSTSIRNSADLRLWRFWGDIAG